MLKKVVATGVLSCVLLGGAFIGCRAVTNGILPSHLSDLGNWADKAVNFTLRDFSSIRQIAPRMLLVGGVVEQDGIFISDSFLIENVAAPDQEVLERNMVAIESFLEEITLPVNMALIPTAVVVKQHELPRNALIYNQKALIDNCYNRLAGTVGRADAYSKLFAARDQYTYYRTETALTSLGGYYVYTALAPRMGIEEKPLNSFEIENLASDYYGSLYETSKYKGTTPDLLTIYRISGSNRQYKTTYTENGEEKSYFTLFPTHLEKLDKAKDVIMGADEKLEISVVSIFEESLLILSDSSAQAYIPFLVGDYGNIVFVNLENAKEETIKQIDISNFDSVLITFSMDKFMHYPLAEKISNITLKGY